MKSQDAFFFAGIHRGRGLTLPASGIKLLQLLTHAGSLFMRRQRMGGMKNQQLFERTQNNDKTNLIFLQKIKYSL